MRAGVPVPVSGAPPIAMNVVPSLSSSTPPSRYSVWIDETVQVASAVQWTQERNIWKSTNGEYKSIINGLGRSTASLPATGIASRPSATPCEKLMDRVSSLLMSLTKPGANILVPDATVLQALHALAHKQPLVFRLEPIAALLVSWLTCTNPSSAATHSNLQLNAASAAAAAKSPSPITASSTAQANKSLFASATASPLPHSASSSPLAAAARKRSPALCVLACQLLETAFRAEETWPLDFARLVLEDFFDARVWVEQEGAAAFVRSIAASFVDWSSVSQSQTNSSISSPPPTISPAAQKKVDDKQSSAETETSVMEVDDASPSKPSPLPIPAMIRNSSSNTSLSSAAAGSTVSAATAPLSSLSNRYAHNQQLSDEVRTLVESSFAKALREAFPQSTSSTPTAGPRSLTAIGSSSSSNSISSASNSTPPHLLRFLSLSMGYRSLRHFSALNIESWLNHPQTNRFAKRLLLHLSESTSKQLSYVVVGKNEANNKTWSKINVTQIPAKSTWNDLAANLKQFTAETLHQWSKASSAVTSTVSAFALMQNLDLATVRILMSMGTRCKTNAASNVASNVSWDESYIEAISRLLRPSVSAAAAANQTASTSSSTSSSSTPSSTALPTPSVLPPCESGLHPTVWSLVFHCWLALDWSNAACMHAPAGATSTPSSHGSHQPSLPPSLAAPSHFLLRVLDLMLRIQPTGGFCSVLSQYLFLVLDRSELIQRFYFVMRRLAWMNSMMVFQFISSPSPPALFIKQASTPTISASTSTSQAVATALWKGIDGASKSYIDFFQFSAKLFDVSSYTHPQNVLLIKEPAVAASLTDAAASVTGGNTDLHKYQLRRELILTNICGLFTFSALVSCQPMLLLQTLSSQAQQQSQSHISHSYGHGSHAVQSFSSSMQSSAPSTSATMSVQRDQLAASSISLMSPASTALSFVLQHNAAATTDSTTQPLVPQRELPLDRHWGCRFGFAEFGLKVWRFSVAGCQSVALKWMEKWMLVNLVADTPGDAAGTVSTDDASPTTATPTPPAAKDVNLLFSELLTQLLFLFHSHQPLLAPFFGPGIVSTMTITATAPKSSSSFYLSELWSVDHIFLKKASTCLIDRLPLLEDTFSSLVWISLNHPLKLPHAYAIQMLEILLRRVCLLAVQVGKNYAVKLPTVNEDSFHHASSHSNTINEEELFTEAIRNPTSRAPFASGSSVLSIQNDELLEAMLQISQFPTPVPPPIPSGYSHPPLLAQSSLYWKCCMLLVILSAFNPNSIGRKSWEKVPTLRCLLEMVVSEIWLTQSSSISNPAAATPQSTPASSFTAALSGGTLSSLFPPFPDLISKSLLNHKTGIELDAILFVENLLPDNRLTPRTKETSLYISHNYLMLLDPSEILRRPPEQFLQGFQKMCVDFGLGTYLRQSRQPNFLTNILSRQTPEQSVGWIRRLVVNEPNTLELLPQSALFELMMFGMEKMQFLPSTSLVSMAQGGKNSNSVTSGFIPPSTVNDELWKRRVHSQLPSSSALPPGRPSLSHSNSLNTSTQNAAAGANAQPTAEPLLDQMGLIITILRRCLPNISHVYGAVRSSAAGASAVDDESAEPSASSSSSSIFASITPTAAQQKKNHEPRGLSISTSRPASNVVLEEFALSELLSPTSPPHLTSPTSATSTPRASNVVSSATVATPTASTTGAPSSSNVPTFNHAPFLELLNSLLARLNARSPATRKSAGRALHYFLCAQPLPHSFQSQLFGCCDAPHLSSTATASFASHGSHQHSQGAAIPQLPPATCWLKFFFTWFLHASSAATVSSAAASNSHFSPSFLASGRLVIRKVCTALMCALEVENDPDVLFGYISFLHATATGFSYSPTVPPSKLFALDLALRVCDVVLSREIIADNLLAPIANHAQPKHASHSMKHKLHDSANDKENGPGSAMKKRKLTDGSNTGLLKDASSAAAIATSSSSALATDSMPDFDLSSAFSLDDPSSLPPLLPSRVPSLSPQVSFTSTTSSSSPSPAASPTSSSPSTPRSSPSHSPNVSPRLNSTPAASRFAVPSLPTSRSALAEEYAFGIIYSGYALILSVLDSAFAVVESMQEDEAFIRRMLAREERKNARLMNIQLSTQQAASGAGTGGVISDSNPSTPFKPSAAATSAFTTPPMPLKRARSSNYQEEDLDEEGESMLMETSELILPNEEQFTPVALSRALSEQSDTAAMDTSSNTTTTVTAGTGLLQSSTTSPRHQLLTSSSSNASASNLNVGAISEAVDEEFVSLHRHWPNVSWPILAYFPLPLLHGIIAFLAFPYALPVPGKSSLASLEKLQSLSKIDTLHAALSPSLQAFARYQHLLSLLLPVTPYAALHQVTLTRSDSAESGSSDSLPVLPVQAGDSLVIDHSGIRWPLPSELQAEQFLSKSSTPLLLLLAIEICSPNQLLHAICQLGLQSEIVQRIFVKLDAWANYQIRMQQKQKPSSATTNAAAAQTSGYSNALLSQGMRDLIMHLPRMIHHVQLYQRILTRTHLHNEHSDNATREVPGDVLLKYLRSMESDNQTSNIAFEISQAVDATAIKIEPVHVSGQEIRTGDKTQHLIQQLLAPLHLPQFESASTVPSFTSFASFLTCDPVSTGNTMSKEATAAHDTKLRRFLQLLQELRESMATVPEPGRSLKSRHMQGFALLHSFALPYLSTCVRDSHCIASTDIMSDDADGLSSSEHLHNLLEKCLLQVELILDLCEHIRMEPQSQLSSSIMKTDPSSSSTEMSIETFGNVSTFPEQTADTAQRLEQDRALLDELRMELQLDA